MTEQLREALENLKSRIREEGKVDIDDIEEVIVLDLLLGLDRASRS